VIADETKLTVKITKIHKRKNFEEMRNCDIDVIKKIYSDEQVFNQIKNLKEFKL